LVDAEACSALQKGRCGAFPPRSPLADDQLNNRESVTCALESGLKSRSLRAVRQITAAASEARLATSFQSQSDRLLERTRGLFALLVSTCDGSRFQASRRMETDLRTIDELRSVPSLRMIDRMGAALGLNASLTAEVLASEPRRRTTAIEIRAAIAEADLADDAAQLERLAAELQQRPEHPSDLGLAHVVCARAAVARGDRQQASASAVLALGLGFARTDAALIRSLAECIEFETVLATPWAAPSARDWPFRRLLEVTAGVDPLADDRGARVLRNAAWLAGIELRRGGVRGSSALARLHELLDAAPDPHSLGWVASIAALAALQAHQHADGTRASPLLALVVRAELALDEACSEFGDRLLLVRRTRVALAEWIARGTLGEIDERMIDGVDEDELARALLWFPTARESPDLHAVAMEHIPRFQSISHAQA